MSRLRTSRFAPSGTSGRGIPLGRTWQYSYFMLPPSARFPARPRAAVAVLVAAAVPAIAGTVLQIASRVPLSPDVLFLFVDVMVALVYGCVAAVILSRRSHPVAWLIALAAVGAGIASLGGGWASFAVMHPVWGQDVGMLLFGSAWVPGTLSLFLVVPWLVRETPLSMAAWCGVVGGALVAGTLTVQRLLMPMADNSPLLVAVVVMGLISTAGVIWRLRYGPVSERPGLGLLALGTAMMALSFLPIVLVPYTASTILLLVPVLHLACQAVYPAAFLVTILRNRLWGIDLAVSRAVVAGLMTLGIVLVYAALVWTASLLVGDSAIAQAIAAVGAVLAVQPIRQLAQRRVRRLVWGDGASPESAALRLGASLSTERDATGLLDRLAAALGESLRLESVVLASCGESEAEGRWGVPSSAPVEVDFEEGDGSSGARGTIAVTPRPGEQLDRRTLESLEQLRPIVAAGFGIVRATDDVARARDAATGARLAERRLIRRELHDGMGPWLSGLQLGLQGARNVLQTDPEAADDVLAALQTETTQRVHDVRMLSRSLLPPVLEEKGLGHAVRELAGTHAEQGFAVEIGGLLVHDSDGLRGLDPRVAAAAYAVISESALNASRHSGAPSCRVDAARASGGAVPTLTVTCSDAGVGRDSEAGDGVGTASMRERVHELGGTFAITGAVGSAGSGTVVTAHIPLTPAEVRP